VTSSVRAVLIPADDLPLHQTSLGLAHTASGDATSPPSLFAGPTGIVAITRAQALPITSHFRRSDQAATGSYMRMRSRLIGCRSSA